MDFSRWTTGGGAMTFGPPAGWRHWPHQWFPCRFRLRLTILVRRVMVAGSTAMSVATKNLAAARAAVVRISNAMNSVMAVRMESMGPVAASGTVVPAFPIFRSHGALSRLGVRMVQVPFLADGLIVAKHLSREWRLVLAPGVARAVSQARRLETGFQGAGFEIAERRTRRSAWDALAPAAGAVL